MTPCFDRRFAKSIKNKTPWFDGDVVPIRDGAYERKAKTTDNIYYSFWDSTRGWLEYKLHLYQCSRNDQMSNFQGVSWRGLDAETYELV